MNHELWLLQVCVFVKRGDAPSKELSAFRPQAATQADMYHDQ